MEIIGKNLPQMNVKDLTVSPNCSTEDKESTTLGIAIWE